MNSKGCTLFMLHCMMYFVNYNDIIQCSKLYCVDMIHGSLGFQRDI